MTPSKAILTGSTVIAAAILAGMFLFRPVVQTPPAAVADASAPADTAPVGRYRIFRTEDGASWRLDTATGEMTACRLDGGRMVCTHSTTAETVPAISADELRKERAASRQRRERQRTAIFERFLDFFDRVLRKAENDAAPKRSAPPPSGGGIETL